MNGLQTLKLWQTYFDHPTAGILGTMNAMYPLGKICGVVLAALLGDRFGRRIPFYFGLVILITGAIIQATSHNVPQFIISRLIVGFGTSFINQPSPILISELAYPTHRGRITSLYFSTYYVGSIVAAWTTYGTFHHVHSNWSWRIPSAVQAGIPFLQLCFAWCVPESPRWLVKKGRVEEARRLLTHYHAGGDEHSALVEFEMREIEESVEIEKMIKSQTSYLDLFRGAANRKRTAIAGIVGFYGSWTGNAVISYYLVLILDTIGITDTPTQALVNGLLQVWNWLCSVCAALLIDRVGRRMLWLISSGGMCCSFIIWTGLNSKFASTQNPTYGRAVLAFIFVFSFFFTIGNSPMAYAYTIEIYPYTLRGRGLSFSISITMAGLILGQFMNPKALDGIGWKYYIVFCVLLGIFFILVWFLFPETKGRTLEEIAEIFDGKSLVSTQAPLKIDHDLELFEGDRKEDIAKAEASEFRNI